MSKIKNIWLRFKNFLSGFITDVRKEVRQTAVKSVAKFTIAIPLVLFILLGGYVAFDKIQDAQNRKKTYRNYCLKGKVLDMNSDSLLENVKVAIQGDSEWVEKTDANGEFKICISIPKDQNMVDMTFFKDGYEITEFNKEGVPTTDLSREYLKPYHLERKRQSPLESLNK